MAEISVIVPVYGVEKYIDECINSIAAQEYTDYELILIDDGSPESSSIVCDAFVLSDPRAVVIHKKNGGLSSARNYGLELVNGQYLSFVDSDDVIADSFLSDMYLAANTEDADVVCCGIKYLKSDHILVQAANEMNSELFPKSMQFLCGTNSVGDYYMNKIFKRYIFRNFHLPEGLIFEDIYTMHLLLAKARKITKINECLYFYRINETGTTHSSALNPGFMNFSYSCKAQYEFYKNNFQDYTPPILNKYLRSLVHSANVYMRKSVGKNRRKAIQELSFLSKQVSSQLTENVILEDEQLSYEIKQLSKSAFSWARYFYLQCIVTALHNHPSTQRALVRIFGWNFIPKEC